MDKLVASLSNHYIVCGFGRMGQQIVKDFRRSNVRHVVVEKNPVQLPKLVEQNVPHIEGKASDDSVLLKAGIQRASGLIAVAATDEENVFIVLTARGLNKDLFIVARSILQENEDKLKRAGADRVISPYVLGGQWMAAAALKPRAINILEFAVHSGTLDLEVGDFVVSSSDSFANKSLGESRLRQSAGVMVLAVKRADGELISNPEPDCLIREGDELIVVGTPAQIDTIRQRSNGSK